MLYREDYFWRRWSKENPQEAAILWPEILRLLRADPRHGQDTVTYLLHMVRGGLSLDYIQRTLTADPDFVVKPMLNVPAGMPTETKGW